jgi:hypothetical protein
MSWMRTPRDIDLVFPIAAREVAAAAVPGWAVAWALWVGCYGSDPRQWRG